ncbi:uncharacterized protein L201_004545 [Kwoniella dendrophila CBS 6074]|uniref:Phytase-like domain-containing protein n=1 Tax=Kwoniella dendrophila CBS 6074 TaxID=1295534 RepID=A0AAX4JW09_9TREE
MRSYTLFYTLPLLSSVLASPIHRYSESKTKLVGRHVIKGRQISHGSGLDSGHALASSTIYLEDREGLALISSQNFTTVIVETPAGSTTSTLVAAFGSQPIYSLGQSAGYILGVPEHIYASFYFPKVDPSKFPLQVCTFVFSEPTNFSSNYTVATRDSFIVNDFSKQLGFGDAVTEFCVRVGNAPSASTTIAGGNPVATSPAGNNGNNNSNGNDNGNDGHGQPDGSQPVTSSANTGNHPGNSGARPATSSALSTSTPQASPSVPNIPASTGPTAAVSHPASGQTSVAVSSNSHIETSDKPAPSSVVLSSSVSSPATSATPSSMSSAASSSVPAASASNASPSSPSGISSSQAAPSASGSGKASSSTSAVASASTASSSTTASQTSVSSTIASGSSSAGPTSVAGGSASASSSATSASISSSASASISSSTSASSSASSSSSVSASTSASASASASASSTGPNPAYQTAVSFAGKSYVNKGLVGFGALNGDAIDSFGETIGGIGSAISLQSFERKSDGTYSGVILAQSDRGHNTDKTTDFVTRRHSISFNLNPYYGNQTLEYQAAKSSFALKYDSTLRYFEQDGTPTTGLDSLAVRNGSVPQPIANSTYNHISTDPEGLVLLADGSSWVSDEYGPYIWKYSADGKLLDTIVPPKAVLPYKNGSLYFTANSDIGPDTGRVPNQGYEGLTISPDEKTLYALLQSSLTQDVDSSGKGRYARMFIYDISGKPTLRHSYVLTLPVTNGKAKPLAQSDVLYLSDNTFMLLSRDGKGNGDDDSESKHKDFMLFNLDGATDLINTEYTDGVKPVAPKGKLDKSITAIEPVEFIDMIDETQLGRFGIHNGGDINISLINGKWESAAIASVQDPEYPNDYFLFSFSDNDFITTNGFEAGEKYVDAYGSTLDNQALVWRITLP